MDFILALHSHLPWVLNHGRWPHGSDWLCEAALDTYLPLLDRLQALEAAQIPAPVTLGMTPVLANQLSAPAFRQELQGFFELRLAACDQAPASLRSTSDADLLPLVDFWRTRFTGLRNLFDTIGGDLVGAFRALERRGQLEIMSSAATHGFLPLLARDESIRLQLALGRAEHRRLFGRDPRGCWLPECAYRPEGRWGARGGVRATVRRGLEAHLAAAGYEYFFVDSHLAQAGIPLGTYGDVPLGAERFDAERHQPVSPTRGPVVRSPYRAYRVGTTAMSVLVRDPASSLQVWSRQYGYPGDGSYLEFHKIRWPEGLKLWRVTGAQTDLGAKLGYQPVAAFERAGLHASHFADVLRGIASRDGGDPSAVVVAPFDAELFGHWWFEGIEFLAELFRGLQGGPVAPVTASRHLETHVPRAALRLAEGSWGSGGGYGMWLSDRTAWTWQRLWALEDTFWDLAPEALASPGARPVLAQAAREILLAQASDWQFIISTDVAADYAERRFTRHCEDAEELLRALAPGAELEAGQRRADELGRRDSLFPDLLDVVASSLEGAPVRA